MGINAMPIKDVKIDAILVASAAGIDTIKRQKQRNKWKKEKK